MPMWSGKTLAGEGGFLLAYAWLFRIDAAYDLTGADSVGALRGGDSPGRGRGWSSHEKNNQRMRPTAASQMRADSLIRQSLGCVGRRWFIWPPRRSDRGRD